MTRFRKQAENVKIEDYQSLDADMYDNISQSPNLIRRLFHQKRFEIAHSLVKKYYKNGYKVFDLACGNCNWNKDNIPVVGVDVSKKMLEYALKKGRIVKCINRDVLSTGVKDKTADIIVATEILEHYKKPDKLVQEIRRILKDEGIVISSVPYDTFFSLWKPLFNLHCFIQGHILGNEYFKNKGGHVNQFSPKTFKELFIQNNFEVVEMMHNKRMTLFLVAAKKQINMPIDGEANNIKLDKVRLS